MKSLVFILSLIGVSAISQVVPTPAPAPSAVGVVVMQWPLIALIVKSVLDLLFAINPKVDAPGGVIDALYLFLKGLVSKQS